MPYRLLDLFCCAGGAAMGYHNAGFEIVGVDICPQPKYPFRFIQADCLTLDRGFLQEFDAIHASPPCQKYSAISRVSGRGGLHKDLIPQTRQMLLESGLPWVIENVVGAPLHDAFLLCGSMFGLATPCGAELRRHRIFETNFWIGLVPNCQHRGPAITVTGSTPQRNVIRNTVRQTFSVGDARAAMGIEWMGMAELSQAIPPAYTYWIGTRLREQIEVGQN